MYILDLKTKRRVIRMEFAFRFQHASLQSNLLKNPYSKLMYLPYLKYT